MPWIPFCESLPDNAHASRWLVDPTWLLSVTSIRSQSVYPAFQSRSPSRRNTTSKQDSSTTSLPPTSNSVTQHRPLRPQPIIVPWHRNNILQLLDPWNSPCRNSDAVNPLSCENRRTRFADDEFARHSMKSWTPPVRTYE